MFCSFRVFFCLYPFYFKMGSGVFCTMLQHPDHFIIFPPTVTLSPSEEVLLSAGLTVEILLVEKSYLNCGGKGI